MTQYTMVFNTTIGTRRSIRIHNPNPDMPLAAIENALEQMIQNDVFDPARGGLESVSRVELTRIEQTILV